ncbi:Formin-like protein 1 [Ancistrocladus abbreviatus]
MDSDVLINDVSKLSQGLAKISEVVRLNEAMGLQKSNIRFSESLNLFMKMAKEEIIRVQAQESPLKKKAQESIALSLVKEITEYFRGNLAKEEAHLFRIFMVVRDFLTILDRVCKEVGMINERTMVSSAHKFPIPVNPMLFVLVNPAVPQVFSAFQGRRQSGSSDDDTSL